MTDPVDNQTATTGAEGAATGAADTSTATTGTATETTAAAAVGTGAGTDGATGTQAPVRPEGLPDELWDAASGLKVGDLVAQWRDQGAKIAEMTKAAGEVPTDVAGYALAVPEGITPPDGFKIAIDESHPFLKEARELALAEKLTPAAWQTVLKFEAARQVAVQKGMIEREVSNRSALGENIDKRIEDINGRIAANLPADVAKAMVVTRYTDPNVVKGLEALWALKSGPTTLDSAGGNVTKYEGLTGADLLAKVRADQAARKAA